jgi:CheY-like chemotaxis protein/HPt (histidine-containing phosphotransfer) domain-containing protein
VVGDELRLRQILINLLGNAIKFSSGLDRVGRVSLKVGRVEVLSPGDTIEVTVSDNGVGIDPKTLGRLFQPFSQADASTTRRFGGTGLGLAITKMLVELQGGRISVESILGEGSTFRVKLPLQPVASTGPAAIERPLSGLQCAIIGADDELAADLSSYLSHAGAKVQRSRRASPREVQESEGRIWLILPDVSEDHRRALRSMGGTRIIALRFGNNAAAAIDKEAEAWLDLDTLTRGSLLRSVAAAAGRSSISPADSGALRAPEAAEPLSAAGSLVAPVLVAEDIETNREVIQRQLKLLGLDAEMTENGQEALERWRSGNFNLVLTDIRMPIMDGYALASAIREEEMGRWRTCIIALTADALPEEEGKCLAAGMDGYLVKPITSSRLKTIIEKSLAARERAMAGETRVAVSAAGPVNLEVLKGLIGDDPAGIAAVLDKFRINSDRLSAEIERAVESDLSAVVDIAHRLKSGAFSIGAKRLGELCVELERAGRGGKKDQLKVLLSQFRTQMQAVREFIDSAT